MWSFAGEGSVCVAMQRTGWVKRPLVSSLALADMARAPGCIWWLQVCCSSGLLLEIEWQPCTWCAELAWGNALGSQVVPVFFFPHVLLPSSSFCVVAAVEAGYQTTYY